MKNALRTYLNQISYNHAGRNRIGGKTYDEYLKEGKDMNKSQDIKFIYNHLMK